MTPTLSRRAALAGGLALAGTAALAPAARALAPAPQWPHVTALFDRYLAADRVTGLVAALGFGTAPPAAITRGVLGRDGPPAGPDSLYRLYSMTKPITGMAAMILIDEGKLALDQPLADLIPAFAKMRVQRTYDGSITDLVPAERPITIRHLLTHTAGLGYTIVQTGPIKAAYESAGLVPGQVSRLPIPGLGGDTIHGLAAFAERLATMPLVAQPGTRWSYSVAFDLLGRVIEIAARQPFETFLHERLLGPLGMASTSFRVAPAAASRLATNYFVLGGITLPIDLPHSSVFLDPPAFAMGGAGLVGSPRDYDRFLAMLLGLGVGLDGKRVMSERAVRLGLSNLLPPGAQTAGTFIAGAGFGAGGRVGLGADEGTFGWSGAAGTLGFISARASLRAGLFTQFMPYDAWPLQKEFPEAVRADLR